ncbi:hypothetical protein J2129_000664 [Methanofollis sp. W23]|nr:hypothetical protein [Methanofollis sp. W23]
MLEPHVHARFYTLSPTRGRATPPDLPQMKTGGGSRPVFHDFYSPPSRAFLHPGDPGAVPLMGGRGKAKNPWMRNENAGLSSSSFITLISGEEGRFGMTSETIWPRTHLES